MRKSWFVLAVGAAFGLVGCGGGGSIGTSGGGETAVGSLLTRGIANQAPTVAGAGSVTVTALPGNFSVVRLRDTRPMPEEGQIVFSTTTNRILQMDYDGRNEQVIYSDPSSVTFVGSIQRTQSGRTYFSRDNQILFLPAGAPTPSVLTSVPGTGNFVNGFSISESETRYAMLTFNNPTSTSFVSVNPMPGSTGSFGSTSSTNFVSALRMLEEDSALYWDGNNIRFFNGAQSFLGFLDFSKPAGLIAVSPARRIIVTAVASGALTTFYSYSYRPNPITPGGYDFITMATVTLNLPQPLAMTFQNDGANLLVVSQNDIYRVNLETQGAELIRRAAPGDMTINAIHHGPVVTDRVLVNATGGSFGATAAGVLVSEKGPVIEGFALWDATTRTTSRTFTEPSGSANTVIRIEADRLTRLQYTPDKSYRYVSAFPASVNVNGALVSIDSSTGDIASVLTYNVTRSGRPKVRVEGDRTVIEGDFEAVTGPRGESLAPGGARSVSLEGAATRVR